MWKRGPASPSSLPTRECVGSQGPLALGLSFEGEEASAAFDTATSMPVPSLARLRRETTLASTPRLVGFFGGVDERDFWLPAWLPMQELDWLHEPAREASPAFPASPASPASTASPPSPASPASPPSSKSLELACLERRGGLRPGASTKAGGRWLGTLGTLDGEARLLFRLLEGDTEGELPATERSSGGARRGAGSFSSLLPAEGAIGGVLPPLLLPPQATVPADGIRSSTSGSSASALI
eukprot:scaffold57729_cov41-Phaeocystis_antarctica.AAC.3